MFEFLKNVYSPSNVASFSRFGAQQALLASILWISIVVYRMTNLSDCGNVAIFIGACGAFFTTIYGIGKYQESKQAADEKPDCKEG